MKEDILEQLAEDWLQAQGYFTRSNLKFKPARGSVGFDSRKDSVHSDIDLIGVHPRKVGSERVVVVTCKSWQDGFEIAGMARALSADPPDEMVGGKEAWKHFRELVYPKWSEAFLAAVKETTGRAKFTYVTAITTATNLGEKSAWEDEPRFKAALNGNPLRIVTLPEMLEHVSGQLGTTVASSQFSRTLQLIRAAGMTVSLEKDGTTKRRGWNPKV